MTLSHFLTSFKLLDIEIWVVVFFNTIWLVNGNHCVLSGPEMASYTVSTLDLFLIISLMDHRDSLFTCLIVLVSLFLCVSTFQIWLIYLNSVLILSLLYLYLSVSVPPAAFHKATNSKTDGDPLGGGKVYTLRHKNNLHIILNVYSLK